MKTQVLYAIAVGLIGLACCLGNGSVGLPGDQIGEGELSKVWAAKTNPGPALGNACTYQASTLVCAKAGDPCGDYSGGTGTAWNLSCTGSTTNKKSKFEVLKCATVTVKSCVAMHIGGQLSHYACSGPEKSKDVGTRDFCSLTNTTISEL